MHTQTLLCTNACVLVCIIVIKGETLALIIFALSIILRIFYHKHEKLLLNMTVTDTLSHVGNLISDVMFYYRSTMRELYLITIGSVSLGPHIRNRRE
jgi:hypothetical protein